MGTFRGSDFEIDVESGFGDESTYAFVLPARAGAAPSIAVKTTAVGGAVALGEYARAQEEMLRSVLPGLELVRAGEVAGGPDRGYETVHDFGGDGERMRQWRRYVLLRNPWRVAALTATAARENWPQTEGLFAAVFSSFRGREAVAG